MGLKNSKKTYGFRQPRRKGAVLGMRSSSTDYFAYGSNMNLPHLRHWLRRFGVEPEGVVHRHSVILPDFCMRTNYITTSGLGAANIEPCQGDAVEGILLSISPDVQEALRAKEGWPRRYHEVVVEVIDPSSRTTVQAVTYRVTPEHALPFDVPVSPRYRRLILKGAKTARLSSAYQSHLRAMLTTPITNRSPSSRRADDMSRDSTGNADRRSA